MDNKIYKMKKQILLIIAILSCIVGYSQTSTIIQGNSNTLVHNKGYLTVDSLLKAGYLFVPIKDTANNPGNMTINPSDSSVYIKVGTEWKIVSGGSGSAQDLQSVLDNGNSATQDMNLTGEGSYGNISVGRWGSDTGVKISGYNGGITLSGDNKGVTIYAGAKSNINLSNAEQFWVSGDESNVKGAMGLNGDGVQLEGRNGSIQLQGGYGDVKISKGAGIAKISDGYGNEVGLDSNSAVSIIGRDSLGKIKVAIDSLLFDTKGNGSISLDSNGVYISAQGYGGVSVSKNSGVHIGAHSNTNPIVISGDNAGVRISGGSGQVQISGGDGGIILSGQGNSSNSLTLEGNIRVKPYSGSYPANGTPLIFYAPDSTVRWSDGSVPLVTSLQAALDGGTKGIKNDSTFVLSTNNVKINPNNNGSQLMVGKSSDTGIYVSASGSTINMSNSKGIDMFAGGGSIKASNTGVDIDGGFGHFKINNDTLSINGATGGAVELYSNRMNVGYANSRGVTATDTTFFAGMGNGLLRLGKGYTGVSGTEGIELKSYGYGIDISTKSGNNYIDIQDGDNRFNITDSTLRLSTSYNGDILRASGGSYFFGANPYNGVGIYGQDSMGIRLTSSSIRVGNASNNPYYLPSKRGLSGQILQQVNSGGTVQWVDPPSGSGSNDSAVWGNITGTLSSQTDLQDSLNQRVNLTTNQTIGGTKIFSNDIFVNGLRVGKGNNSVATNVVVGTASAITSGSQNNLIGGGVNITTGSSNTALGYNSLNTTTGANNVAIGTQSLQNPGIKNQNVAIGSATLFNANTGSGNVAVGYNNSTSVTSGTDNIAIGKGALPYTSTGTKNIAIGVNAGPETTGTSLSDKLYIGHKSSMGASDTLITILGDLSTRTLRFPKYKNSVGEDSVMSTSTDGTLKLKSVSSYLTNYLLKSDSTIYYPYASNPLGYITDETQDLQQVIEQDNHLVDGTSIIADGQLLIQDTAGAGIEIADGYVGISSLDDSFRAYIGTNQLDQNVTIQVPNAFGTILLDDESKPYVDIKNPNKTGLQTNGGLATNITQASSNYSLSNRDQTVIMYGDESLEVTLPDPADFPNRIIRIVNSVANEDTVNFVGSFVPTYYNAGGLTPTTKVEWISDGRPDTIDLQSTGSVWMITLMPRN